MTFLPLYGFTIDTTVEKAEEDEESDVDPAAQEDEFSDDDDGSMAISEDLGDDSDPGFDPNIQISWQTRQMLLEWLGRARSTVHSQGATTVSRWQQHLHEKPPPPIPKFNPLAMGLRVGTYSVIPFDQTGARFERQVNQARAPQAGMIGFGNR